jgi:hypothetical protein
MTDAELIQYARWLRAHGWQPWEIAIILARPVAA